MTTKPFDEAERVIVHDYGKPLRLTLVLRVKAKSLETRDGSRWDLDGFALPRDENSTLMLKHYNEADMERIKRNAVRFGAANLFDKLDKDDLEVVWQIFRKYKG